MTEIAASDSEPGTPTRTGAAQGEGQGPAIVAGLTLVGPASLSLLIGSPTLWAPMPGVIVAMSFLGLSVLDLIIGPVLFWAWSPQLLKGKAPVPSRSTIGLVILTLATAAYFALSWPSGLTWQGRSHVVGTLILNVLVLTVVWVSWVVAVRRPSFTRSLAFHWLTVAWLVWCAFPALGELP